MKSDLVSEEPLLLRVSEAARLLSVSKRTLYRLWDGGELPRPRKVKGSTRVLRSDIEDYVNRLFGKPGSPA